MRRGRAAALALCLLLSGLFLAPDARATTYPVTSENVVTGTTTGISGAQNPDGIFETMTEANTAPPANSYPVSQTISLGSQVAGTFPTDIQTANGVYIQYREGKGPVDAEAAYRSNTGTNTVNSPKTRTWNGTGWSTEAEQATAGSPLRAVRIAWSPISTNTYIVVTLSDDGWLDAYVCSPTCTVTNNIGQVWSTAPGIPERPFDVAYEYTSGDALLVYGVLSTDPTRDIAYRTFVGGTWSAEQYLDDTSNPTDVQYTYIGLASKKGSDQIGLVGGESTNNHVNAWIWDGSAWGSNTLVTATAQAPNRERAAIAWETNSGHLLAVAVNSTNPANIVSKEFTTGWGAATTFQCGSTGNIIRWLALKPNPVGTASDMVMAVGDDGSQLNTCYWTGSAWANLVNHDTAIDTANSRAFDFAWENSSSKGLLVWGTTAGQITYRTFTAPNTWGAITNVAMGSNTHPWVQLRTNLFPQAGGTKILGAVMEATALGLGSVRWDGTTFAVIGATSLTANAGTTAYESFDLEYRAAIDYQLNTEYDWTGVPSGQNQMLVVGGHVTDEAMNVQVLTTPSTWNTRLTITTPSDQTLYYNLTGSEYNSGNPSIRFIDANGPDGTQSDMYLDLVRIVTTVLNYRLEVQQDVTGVTGILPVLRIKGNISTGGENFDVQVRNWTGGGWDLRLASPFTSTNAWHNASLPPQDVSGTGLARVRFLDTIVALDTTKDSLSLDYAAVTTNDPPTLINNGVSPSSGNITTSFTFYIRYTDPDNDAPQYVRLRINSNQYDMVANDSSTNYAAGKDYHYALVIGLRGTFNYNFTAQAATGVTSAVNSSTRQVQVLNRPPTIINPVVSDTTYRSLSYARSFMATDPENDTITWSLASNATFLRIGASNGTVYGFTPSLPATYYARVIAADGFGGSAVMNYTLRVVDRRPTITNRLTAQSYHPLLYSRTFTALDPDGDPLTWSMAANATWLTIGMGNGTIWGTRPLGNHTFYVNVSVRDLYGLRDFDNYTLTVGNIPPRITTAAGNTSGFRVAFNRTLGAYDADGDTLNWSLATNGAFLSIDPSTGAVTSAGTPPPGTYYARVSVVDGFGGSDSVNFTVAFLNRPPSISATPQGTAIGGTPYGAAFPATDPDGDPLTWSLATNATWLSMDSPGHLYGRPVPGTYYVNVTARDAYGGTAYHNYTLVVTPAPGSPLDSLYLWTILGALVAASVVLLSFVAYRRRPKGDVILKAYLFTDKAVVLQELVSDKEEPAVKFREIFKFLVGGKVAGDHWLDLPPYKVAVVQEGKLHLAAVSRVDKQASVMGEAHKLLLSLLGDEDVKAALPQGEAPPPTTDKRV